MAFVPTAALKRKKRPVATITSRSSINLNNISDSSNKKNIRPEMVEKQQATTSTSTSTVGMGVVETTITTTTTKKIDQKKQTAVVVDIHGNYVDGSNSLPQSAAADVVINIDDDNNNESNEKITDPYDPFVPNDLLEYWEKQAATRQRKKLERETRESLERQKSIRKKINEERLELQKSGNYSTLIERERERNEGVRPSSSSSSSGHGHGRGRGRGGVSNLPAWLVEKQRREAEDSIGATNSSEGVVIDEDSNTMIGRGRGRGGVSNLPAWLIEKQRNEHNNSKGSSDH